MGTAGLKLVVRGKLPFGQEWRNSFYWQTEDDFGDAAVAAWVTDLYGTISAITNNYTTIYGVDVATRLTSYVDTDTRGWGASTFIPVTWSGSVSGEMLPSEDCYVVIGQTGVKHVLARKFLSGIPESMQDGGTLVTSAKTGLTNFAHKWVTPGSRPTLTGGFSSWGPTHGWVPLISARGDVNVYQMTRRRVGRGI